MVFVAGGEEPENNKRVIGWQVPTLLGGSYHMSDLVADNTAAELALVAAECGASGVLVVGQWLSLAWLVRDGVAEIDPKVMRRDELCSSASARRGTGGTRCSPSSRPRTTTARRRRAAARARA